MRNWSICTIVIIIGDASWEYLSFLLLTRHENNESVQMYRMICTFVVRDLCEFCYCKKPKNLDTEICVGITLKFKTVVLKLFV